MVIKTIYFNNPGEHILRIHPISYKIVLLKPPEVSDCDIIKIVVLL